jgi:hypothetical protein
VKRHTGKAVSEKRHGEIHDPARTATSVWGITYQVLEQLGFRKIVDTTFMIAFMFPHGVDPADVDKYMQGLKRAQMDLDFASEKYKLFYLNEIPDRYKSRIDVRRFSTGERIVFLPYGEEIYARTQEWVRRAAFSARRPPASTTRPRSLANRDEPSAAQLED